MSNVKTTMMDLLPGHMLEGDEFGPDANGDYWIEDAYAGYVKKKGDQVDGGIEDAPEDGDLYGRRGADGIEDAAWEKLPLAEFEEEAARLQGEIDQEKFYRVEEDQKLEAQINALKAAGVTVSDSPPPSPEEGMLWFNSSENELTLYIFEGSVWVPAAPPVSLDGINATIEAALVVQSDLQDAVNKGVEEQNKIKLDLKELQVTKGSVARYKITATHIGAAGRNGELYVNNAAAADVQAMSFAPFDLNGQPIKPCNPGDIIELVEAVALADIGEVCRYRIVSGESQALTVEYLSGTNDFAVDETQEVYIYPQNEAGASKEYVDEKDSNLKDYTDGQIADLQSQIDSSVTKQGNQDLEPQNWRMRQPNAEGNYRTYVNIHDGEMHLYHVADPTGADDAWAATKGYADKHLPKTGGTLTGVVNIAGDSRIKTKDADGNTTATLFPSGLFDSKSELRSDRPNATDQCIAVKQSGTTKFSINANGKASSKYSVSSSDSGETLATKRYVDNTSGGLAPARLAWKYGGSVDSSADPGQGNFVWHPGGSDNILGYMRLSFASSNGCDIGDGKFNDTNVTFDYGPIGTIWQWRSDTGKWKLIMQVRIQKWRWNYNNHFEFGLTSTHGRSFSDLGSNLTYFITAGGFF